MKQNHTSADNNNEQGFILILVLIMLVITSLLGTFASRTSIIEVQIAGNDKVMKQTFYQADGGSELGSRLTEENIFCPQGFSSDDLTIGPNSDIFIEDRNFIKEDDYSIDVGDNPANRHAYFPVGYNTDAPHTNLLFASTAHMNPGNAVQSMAGYEGRGRGAAAGGGQIITDIWSQHYGKTKSETVVHSQWQHIIGIEGTCSY